MDCARYPSGLVVEWQGSETSTTSDKPSPAHHLQMLPWDWDIDTQVSGPTLNFMGKHFNQTIHTYLPPESEKTYRYLLDVNPWAWERVRGDGNNIIDARWIDTTNGLYIDITGLSETSASRPDEVSCKNDHHYDVKDLYPMRESVFEGVPAKIPYAYDKILVDEYQEKSLMVTEYEGYLLRVHLFSGELKG